LRVPIRRWRFGARSVEGSKGLKTGKLQKLKARHEEHEGCTKDTKKNRLY